MKKIIMCIGLALAASLLISTSALALLANHDYRVRLSSVAADEQQTMVDEIAATSDMNGKLTFHFDNVPDTTMAPFLMVEIIDMTGGAAQVVRQSLTPTPTHGQAMEIGVNETSHRQTRATLRAFNAAGGADALHLMFPLAMISSGALSDADADSLGMMAADATMTFENYLGQNGIDTAQMDAFKNELLEAMRTLAGNCRQAVDEIDPLVAAGRHGRADGEFMQAVIDAAATAGIDPELLSAAFDQARMAMENAPEALALSPMGYAMFDATFMAGHQQRQLRSQLRHYADAMMTFNADAEQVQTFTSARNALHEAMLQARQDYQQIFADPDNLPDQATIDQARADYDAAIQAALDAFMTATTATDQQIDNMLGLMASHMSGGMMGGGMMNSNDLMNMGFGQMMQIPGGTTQNWSTMMLAAVNLPGSVPDMSYTPATTGLMLELGQLQPTPSLPTEPDWTLLPDGTDRSLLHLQFDLMLTAMIDQQLQDNFGMPLSVEEQTQLSERHLANQAMIHQGLQGLTNDQKNALLDAMSPLHQY